ncbi:MAG: hypothetical protein V4722_08890 [Bacteroidota bacterium]
MKHFLTLFTVIIIKQFSFAQSSVGIGTTTPNASAALDIQVADKGLLIPRVFLVNASDKTTIVSPAISLLVYNTNYTFPAGMGYYFNKGTAQSPNWTKMNDLDLPIYKGTSSSGSLFQLDNYNQSAASSAIKGYSASGTGIIAGSSIGYALEANGKIKIIGTSQLPAQGKVLTSDASGNATWEGAIAFSAAGIVGNGSESMAGNNVMAKVPFAIVNYDFGNNYSGALETPHSTFTAPVNGIYHFDAQLVYFGATVDGPAIYLKLKRDGNESTIATYCHSESETRSSQLSIGKDVQLQTGDQVYVVTKHSTSGNRSLLVTITDNWFSGRLVMRL